MAPIFQQLEGEGSVSPYPFAGMDLIEVGHEIYEGERSFNQKGFIDIFGEDFEVVLCPVERQEVSGERETAIAPDLQVRDLEIRAFSFVQFI